MRRSSPHRRSAASLRRLAVGLAVAATAALAAAPVASGHGRHHAPRCGTGVDVWLTLLHNNDGESKLVNAGVGDLVGYGGVARFRTLVGELRDEGSHPAKADDGARRRTVLVSSGDNFLAGPVFNASLTKGVPFYDSIALKRIGYDAVAIGNHEFDFGPDVLADFIAGFDRSVPFVSANLDVSAEPRLKRLARERQITSSTVVWKDGIAFGIVGATTPLLPAISSPRGVVAEPDVAGIVQAEVNRLTRRGVKRIVLISHLQSVQEDLALIPQLKNVDLAVAGGGDELLANEGDLLVPGDVRNPELPYPLNATDAEGRTVPVVTTAGDYKYVGRLVAGFDRCGRVVDVDDPEGDVASGPVRVSGNPADADYTKANPALVRRVVAPVEAAVAELAADVVGQSAVALEGRRSPGIRDQETNLGDLTADALLFQARELAPTFGVPAADVGIENSGGIRNNSLIPAGPITAFDTFSINAFANFLSVVPDVPAAQLKEILENAVSLMPTSDGRFAQIGGFRFTYDVTGTAQVVDNAGTVLTPGSRVREVVLDDGRVLVANGAVVAGAPAVSIATNDFSARGGDQYPFRGLPFTTLGVTYQQALRNYIEAPTWGLGGQITAADYPEGGEGRITRVN